MSNEEPLHIFPGRASARGDSTLTAAVYSNKGRLGKLIISVSVIDLEGHVSQTPPEVLEMVAVLLNSKLKKARRISMGNGKKLTILHPTTKLPIREIR